MAKGKIWQKVIIAVAIESKYGSGNRDRRYKTGSSIMIMGKQSGQELIQHTERRIPADHYATGSAAELAIPVRGSSRGIKTIHAGGPRRSPFSDAAGVLRR
jgi:hypothetical protein